MTADGPFESYVLTQFKDLGLAELGAAHAGRASVDLQLRDVWRFVGLGMRAIGDAGLGREGRHVRDVTLEGGRIEIRMARKGERFLPLGDGAQELELNGTELVIADAAKPVALAGVKGTSTFLLALTQSSNG